MQRIHNQTLHRLLSKKIIEKISHGIYLLTEYLEDDHYLFQLRYPKTIFSYETALYLIHETDFLPINFDVSVTKGYKFNDKENIRVNYVSDELADLGKIKVKTMFNNDVYVYCYERVLCDLIKNRKKANLETYVNAIKRYAQYKNKNLDLLYEIAKKMNILDEMKNIMIGIIY